MDLSRRRLLQTGLFGLTSSVLGACRAGVPVAPTPVPPPATPQAVTLRLATNDSGEALTPFQPIIAGFQRQYPWITVAIESSLLADYYNTLLRQIEQGSAPDVVQIGEEHLPRFADQGALENLTRFMVSPNAPLDPNIYLPGVFRPGQWQGETYLLPKDFSTIGVFYNKSLFDAADIPYPKEGWTWQDFRAVAQALTDPAKQQYGVQLSANWVRGFEYWVSAAAGKLISDDGTMFEGYLNSPAVAEALTFYAGLYADGLAAPPTDVDKLETPRSDFVDGKAAMRPYGRWPQAGFLQNPALKPGLAVAPPPSHKQPATVIAWAGFGIKTTSQHKEAAWLLVRYLGGPEGSREWANWGLPAVQAVAGERKLSADPLDSVWIGTLSRLRPLAAYASPYWGAIGEPEVRKAIAETLTTRDPDIAKILDAAAARAQEALDKQLAAQ